MITKITITIKILLLLIILIIIVIIIIITLIIKCRSRSRTFPTTNTKLPVTLYNNQNSTSDVAWVLCVPLKRPIYHFIIISIIIIIIIIIMFINIFFFLGIIQHLKILEIVFRPKKLIKANYKSSKM